MTNRNLAALFLITAFTLLLPQTNFAQSGETIPQTSWGKPDIQGVWDFATMTPMERPAQFADKAILTEEDAASVVANSDALWQRISEGGDDSTGTYDEFWFDAGSGVTEDRRTSLITDPPDGKVPAMTATATERVAARRKYLVDHPADSWEDRGIAERCILGFNTGPPMTPSAYNNVVQIFQTEDHVVLLNEMVHDSRVVPLDNRPHLPPHVRQWHGDSRGYWDGNTLVIETINLTNKTSYRGSTESMHLIERFTRINNETLNYEFTVNDPRAFTRPWTALVPMKMSSSPIYEYACHEGNYGMEGILAGHREAEREAMKSEN
tara:strand:+ start:1787 stop:2752 length:966 start_codon:yes stop_codon:yes gene_type:complete